MEVMKANEHDYVPIKQFTKTSGGPDLPMPTCILKVHSWPNRMPPDYAEPHGLTQLSLLRTEEEME